MIVMTLATLLPSIFFDHTAVIFFAYLLHVTPPIRHWERPFFLSLVNFVASAAFLLSPLVPPAPSLCLRHLLGRLRHLLPARHQLSSSYEFNGTGGGRMEACNKMRQHQMICGSVGWNRSDGHQCGRRGRIM
jgi:hypothetical protein